MIRIKDRVSRSWFWRKSDRDSLGCFVLIDCFWTRHWSFSVDGSCTEFSAKKRNSRKFRDLIDPFDRRDHGGNWMSTLAFTCNTHDLVDTADY